MFTWKPWVAIYVSPIISILLFLVQMPLVANHVADYTVECKKTSTTLGSNTYDIQAHYTEL